MIKQLYFICLFVASCFLAEAQINKTQIDTTAQNGVVTYPALNASLNAIETASGKYTATLSNQSNGTWVTYGIPSYQKIGKQVMVRFSLSYTPVALSVTSVDFTLPFSTTNVSSQMVGSVTTNGSNGCGAVFIQSSNTARVVFHPTITAGSQFIAVILLYDLD